MMKNKQAKRLLLNACVRVNRLSEVSWMNSISITGSDLKNGATIIHSEYLGVAEDSINKIAEKCDAMNFPKCEPTQDHF